MMEPHTVMGLSRSRVHIGQRGSVVVHWYKFGSGSSRGTSESGAILIAWSSIVFGVSPKGSAWMFGDLTVFTSSESVDRPVKV